MTAIITLEEAKAFLRVCSDHEDALIEQLCMTASETAMAHADGLAEDEPVPESVRTAALIHVACLFDNREEGEAPTSSQWLSNRYRAWGV